MCKIVLDNPTWPYPLIYVDKVILFFNLNSVIFLFFGRVFDM